jgi:hypothetical protein
MSEAAVWLIPRCTASNKIKPALTWEPVSGIEPLTCRLQEDRPSAPYALPALKPLHSNQNAQNTQDITLPSFHVAFHAFPNPTAGLSRRVLAVGEGEQRTPTWRISRASEG